MILANLVFSPEYLSARTESTTIQIDFRLARMRAVLFRSLTLPVRASAVAIDSWFSAKSHLMFLGSDSTALYPDSAKSKTKLGPPCPSYIQPPARFKQDPATLPTAFLDLHGCKESKNAVGSVAQRGARSKTSGSLTPAIQF